ncbi:hypothetical protein MRX96_011270 [Rhipicephalus microplus]
MVALSFRSCWTGDVSLCHGSAVTDETHSDGDGCLEFPKLLDRRRLALALPWKLRDRRTRLAAMAMVALSFRRWWAGDVSLSLCRRIASADETRGDGDGCLEFPQLVDQIRLALPWKLRDRRDSRRR